MKIENARKLHLIEACLFAVTPNAARDVRRVHVVWSQRSIFLATVYIQEYTIVKCKKRYAMLRRAQLFLTDEHVDSCLEPLRQEMLSAVMTVARGATCGVLETPMRPLGLLG